jgi:drug/metabolite transporter (DMT)-like permease
MLLISTSGVLGRYISMPPQLTIFWRALLAALFLFVFCKLRKISMKINWKKDGVSLFFGGLFMGLHWVTYFYALQLSNVAIGMLSIFTYPVITTFLEPLLLKTKFEKTHVLLGFLVLIGIYFLVPEFDLSNQHTKAVGFGVFSALCYSLRNIIMKNRLVFIVAPL